MAPERLPDSRAGACLWRHILALSRHRAHRPRRRGGGRGRAHRLPGDPAEDEGGLAATRGPLPPRGQGDRVQAARVCCRGHPRNARDSDLRDSRGLERRRADRHLRHADGRGLGPGLGPAGGGIHAHRRHLRPGERRLWHRAQVPHPGQALVLVKTLKLPECGGRCRGGQGGRAGEAHRPAHPAKTTGRWIT